MILLGMSKKDALLVNAKLIIIFVINLVIFFLNPKLGLALDSAHSFTKESIMNTNVVDPMSAMVIAIILENSKQIA